MFSRNGGNIKRTRHWSPLAEKKWLLTQNRRPNTIVKCKIKINGSVRRNDTYFHPRSIVLGIGEKKELKMGRIVFAHTWSYSPNGFRSSECRRSKPKVRVRNGQKRTTGSVTKGFSRIVRKITAARRGRLNISNDVWKIRVHVPSATVLPLTNYL